MQAHHVVLVLTHYARLRRATAEQLCLPRWQTSLPTRLFLVILLCELKIKRFSHFVLCFGNAKTLAEQSATAVLMSKLLDTSVLDYLRRRSLCERRRKGGKSFLLRRKEKYGTLE